MRTTIAVAVLFLVAVGAIVSPPHVTYQVKSLLTPSSDQDKCFAIHKDKFNDPWATYPTDSFVISREKDLAGYYFYMAMDERFKEYDQVLSVKVSTINRFGARDHEYVRCPLVDGKFDAHRARLWAIGD